MTSSPLADGTNETYESLKSVIVWRAIAMRTFAGGMSGFPHTEYLYDDRILITHLGDYLKEITERNPGISKISLTRLGPLENVWYDDYKPRPGTESFTKGIRKIPPLEAFK